MQTTGTETAKIIITLKFVTNHAAFPPPSHPHAAGYQKARMQAPYLHRAKFIDIILAIQLYFSHYG